MYQVTARTAVNALIEPGYPIEYLLVSKNTAAQVVLKDAIT